MKEATLRCKRFLQVILSKEATPSIKRMQSCTELEVLLEDIAEALPDTERTAVRYWRFMNNCSPGTPWHISAGVLAWLPLSPSEHGASWKVSQTLKPTTSSVEDIRVSEQDARLSFVATLACDFRPAPDAALEGARQEKRGTPLPGGSSPYGLTGSLFQRYSFSAGNKWKCPTTHHPKQGTLFISRMNDGGEHRDLSCNHKKPVRKLGGGGLAPSKPGAQMSREVSPAYSSRGLAGLQAQGGSHATPSLS
jgi:hypothetical protein